jgi:hypothetical protein
VHVCNMLNAMSLATLVQINSNQGGGGDSRRILRTSVTKFPKGGFVASFGRRGLNVSQDGVLGFCAVFDVNGALDFCAVSDVILAMSSP